MKFDVAKRLKALKGVSPLLAAIILIAGTIAGSLLVYTLYFSSANTAAANSLVSVSPMLMKAGDTAKLALNFKNIGTKPVVKIEYTFNGEETQVLDVEVPPGHQVSTVFTPAHPENFIVGNNYLLVVKATYSDGSTSTEVLSVMCSGWGGPSGLPGGEEEGAALTPWDDYFYYLDTFQSLDGWCSGTTGSATVEVNCAEGLILKTGSQANSLAEVSRVLTYIMRYPGFSDHGFSTWNKSRGFRVWFLPYALTNQEAIIAVGTDALLTYPDLPHVGFRIVDGVLYGSCGDGSGHTTVELVNLDIIVYKAEWRLVVDGDVRKVLFYVNDELKGEITTNIPQAPPDDWDYSAGIYIALKNTAAEPKILCVNVIELWQNR